MSHSGEAPPDGTALPTAFSIDYQGLLVDLTVFPRAPGADPVDHAEVVAALRRAPIDRFSEATVIAAIESAQGTPVNVAEIAPPSTTTVGWFIQVSPDRLAAYAVPLPDEETAAALDTPSDKGEKTTRPLASGPLVSASALRDALATQGVAVGLLEDPLGAFAPPRNLTVITCLARGEEPVGRDAELVYGFDPDPKFAPVDAGESRVDFRTLLRARFIEEGTTLVTYHPPVPAAPGQDVFGESIPAPKKVVDADLAALCGDGTALRGDTLIATRPGRPVRHERRIDILELFEVERDLDYSVGDLHFPGDIVIRGDILPGFTVEAGGSVIVGGVSEAAAITAQDAITLGSVPGTSQTTLTSGADLVANYLQRTVVHATGVVRVARELMGCTVQARRVETQPQGRIVGGVIKASEGIDTGMLGSKEGVTTEIHVVASRSDVKPGVKPVVRAHGGVCPGVRLRM